MLDKPFRSAAQAAGITKHITPKAMRRTFQDLARAVEVKDLVARAISGNATEQMQHQYSTVNAGEMRTSIAKVVHHMRRQDRRELSFGQKAVALRTGLQSESRAQSQFRLA